MLVRVIWGSAATILCGADCVRCGTKTMQVSVPHPFNFVFHNITFRSTGTVTTHNTSKWHNKNVTI